jgi:hypothetical protein
MVTVTQSEEEPLNFIKEEDMKNLTASEKLTNVAKILVDKQKKDPSSFRAKKMLRTISGSISRSNAEENEEEENSILASISRLLDEHVYDPYFQSRTGEFENAVSESAIYFTRKENLDKMLRAGKIISFIACPLFFILSIRNLRPTRSNLTLAYPFYASIYGVLCVDSLRVSYNCYSKNYCAIALRRVYNNGDALKIADAAIQWAQVAIGIKDSEEDHFEKLKKQILWSVVTTDCLITKLCKKVKVAITITIIIIIIIIITIVIEVVLLSSSNPNPNPNPDP